MNRRELICNMVIAPVAAIAAKLGFGKTATPTALTGFSNSGLGHEVVTESKDSMLAILLQTPAGRAKLAASLGPSLRKRKHFMSFSSSPTIHTQDSTLIRHLDDLKLTAVGENGGDVITLTNGAFGRRIVVPVFAIVSTPMIPVEYLNSKRFDLVARGLNLAKAEVGNVENSYILGLWDTAAKLANANELDGNKDIPFPGINEFWGAAEETFKKRGLTMKAAFVNPKTGGVEMLKQFGKPITQGTERKDLIRGILGWKDGVEIRHSHSVDPNFMYFTAEKISGDRGRQDLAMQDYTKSIHAAYIIEETPLRCVTADRPDLEQIGFSISEEVGFAANPVAVQRIQFDKAYVEERTKESSLRVEDINEHWEDFFGPHA